MIQYPLISEYEVAIKKSGSGVLRLPESYEFIPNRTVPIKFFNFGSGAFAGIFKVRKNSDNKQYALRCFLNGGNPENIERVIKISDFLEGVSDSWVCKNKVFRNGIKVKDSTFPVILMEWSSGKKINDYVSGIIADNNKIAKLQEKLVELSRNLESKNIAHGDIQSGNILVEESYNNIVLKLVDYDAMYVPLLMGKQAIETGHSSFQHPKRNKSIYNETIDRFSFWLILTALEAIKFDKTLWNKDLRGGFNDEDNFLFKAKDLSSPQTSQLVNRLRGLNQKSLNFYLDKLFSSSFSSVRDKVSLYTFSSSEKSNTNPRPTAHNEQRPKAESVKTGQSTEKFLIESVPSGAQVFLISGFSRTLIGATPLVLSVNDFASKQIIVCSEQSEKAFFLNRSEKNYRIDFASQQNSALKYGVFIKGDKKDITLQEVETYLVNGYNFGTVEVNGERKLLEDVPEIKKILDKYGIKSKSTATNPNPTPQVATSNNNDSNVAVWSVLGILVFAGLIWLLIANSKKTETVETGYYSDSAAIAIADSAAMVVDSAATVVVDSAATYTVDAAAAAAATNSSIIQNAESNTETKEERSYYKIKNILGSHRFSLQWISWEKFGKATIYESNGNIFIDANQSLEDDYVRLNGKINIIESDHFTVEGILVTKVSYINNGNECKRSGVFNFRTRGRPYFRMMEMDNPCDDPITDYVDIYIK